MLVFGRRLSSGVRLGTTRPPTPRPLLASGGSRRPNDAGDAPSNPCTAGFSSGGGERAAGYQSMGSFHSDNIDLLRALPAAEYHPPPLPRGLPPIDWKPTHATNHHAAAAPPYANDDAAKRLDEAIAHAASCELGRELKAAHFLLDPEWTFVNHGAFGAAVRIAHDHAAAWRRYSELQPLRFFDRDLLPHLTHSLRAVASFVGADPQDVVLGPNATSLLNAVVLSGTHTSPHQSRHGDAGDGDGERTGSGLGGGVAVAQHPLFALQRGDHVLLLDTAYGGVKKLCAEACRRAGAALDVVPLPLPLPGSAALETSATADAAAAAAAAASCVEAIACRVRATPSGRAALVVLDHTTSNTALTLPVAAMAAAAKAAGARCVLVDGAHGVWAQDLDLPALGRSGVDFYVGNCHKWLCAPRGAALLWAKAGLRWRRGGGGRGAESSLAELRPAVVSHGYGDGAWSAFAWDGCRDYGAALSLPPLLRFWGHDLTGRGANGGGGSGGGGSSGGVGRARALAYTRSLLADACALLRARWLPAGGGFGVAPESFAGPMALVALPEALWRRPGDVGAAANDATSADAKRVQDALHHGFRVEAPIKCLHGRLWVRLSAHVYNDLRDYERFAVAVEAVARAGD